MQSGYTHRELIVWDFALLGGREVPNSVKQMREEAGSQEEAPFWADISEGTVHPCRQASSPEGPHSVEIQTLPSRELYPNQGSGSPHFPRLPSPIASAPWESKFHEVGAGPLCTMGAQHGV